MAKVRKEIKGLIIVKNALKDQMFGQLYPIPTT